MEDKQKICDLLVPVLQETRDFQELESLKYNKDNEIWTYASDVSFAGLYEAGGWGVVCD